MINNAEYLIQKYAEAREKQEEYKQSDAGRLYWKGAMDAYHSLLVMGFLGWADKGTTGYYVFHKEMSYDEAIAKASKNKVEWMYNFIGGGWNTEWAFTREQAIAQARERWSDSPNLKIDESSFYASTPEAIQSALSTFY
jgi:hypothetical protein